MEKQTRNIIIGISISISILILILFLILHKKTSSSSKILSSPSSSHSPSSSPSSSSPSSSSPSSPSSSNLQNKSISINGITRNYSLNINSNDTNVLLCFPGGGETMETFISYTGLDQISSSVIFFEGQKSINGYSWQNAFPWLKNTTIQNDVLFVDTVLTNIYNNIPNIFLTGKSDGGGFCVYYSNFSKYTNNIEAIGIFSSAHFGLTSASNITPYDINNTITIPKTNIIIPQNIILPSSNVSIFLIHGTRDQVMPYKGQNFTSGPVKNTLSIWNNIDTGIPNKNNTYTVNIPSYISSIQQTFSNNIYNNSNSNYSWNSSTSPSNLVFNSISIVGQNHDWSGHTNNSGPDCSKQPNLYLDATYLLIKFLKLDQGNYKPTISTIPLNLRTYDNNII